MCVVCCLLDEWSIGGVGFVVVECVVWVVCWCGCVGCYVCFGCGVCVWGVCVGCVCVVCVCGVCVGGGVGEWVCMGVCVGVEGFVWGWEYL